MAPSGQSVTPSGHKSTISTKFTNSHSSSPVPEIPPAEVQLIVAYLRANYDVLGLDMDGSCVRNEYTHHECALKNLISGLDDPQVRDQAKKTITWAWWRSNLGSGQYGIYSKLKALFPSFSLEADAFVRKWEDSYVNQVEQSCKHDPKAFLDTFVRPGLYDLVSAFADKPVFVYSVSETRLLNANLSAIDIRHDFAISGDWMTQNNKALKPSPAGWQEGLARIGAKMNTDINPARTLILEDTDKGMKAVHALGAHGVRVSWPGEVPTEPFHYRVREDTHIFEGFKDAAADWAAANASELKAQGIPASPRQRLNGAHGCVKLVMNGR